jgi:CRISPR/Cas system Type II protein with McrA/HNH and RuvC-like nuclease domain
MHYLKNLAAIHLGDGQAWEVLRGKLAAQGGRCAYTGDALVLGENDSIDHILPKSRFPEDARNPDNVQWVTRYANMAKRDQTHDEFVGLVARISEHLRF